MEGNRMNCFNGMTIIACPRREFYQVLVCTIPLKQILILQPYRNRINTLKTCSEFLKQTRRGFFTSRTTYTFDIMIRETTLLGELASENYL